MVAEMTPPRWTPPPLPPRRRERKRAGQRHWTPAPPYYYTLSATPQGRTEVKLNRVFLPRRFCHARSRGCGFTRT